MLPDGVDYRAVAERLVRQSARIRRDDLVQILGGPKDIELLEELATEVRRLGAFPLVRVESDRMIRLSYDRVPADFDSQPPRFDLRLADLIDAFILVPSAQSDTVYKGLPPERLTRRFQAFNQVVRTMQRRGVRTVELGNGLYPTADAAQRFGLEQGELARIFWRGVNTDYDRLQAVGERVRRLLLAGKELHLTNPNGTDLRVRIAGQAVGVSDGVISSEDERRGGAATRVWLPAGEVYVTPVPGTAEGTVVADRHFFEGALIEGLRLEFKRGQLTSMTARSGLEPLRKIYDAAPASGKDQFSAIDIGLNPDVVIPEHSRMVGWMPAGMVTVAVGNNLWAGGTNEAAVQISPFLPGSTLTVDGRALVKDGRLVVTEAR